MAANLATASADSCLLDRRRNRLETSSRGMTSSPQDRQMDTALVDHADWKLSLGPTCTLQLTGFLSARDAALAFPLHTRTKCKD